MMPIGRLTARLRHEDSSMKKRWHSFFRTMAPLLGAGFLLQTSGCSLTIGDIAQGVLTSAAGQLITTYVFGAFNIPTSGFF
jgi:hypothetical protein